MRHNSHACASLVHALQCRLRAWQPITFLGNAYSVDVMIHAWERKFVYCSADTRDSQCDWRLKASHYIIREPNAVVLKFLTPTYPLVKLRQSG